MTDVSGPIAREYAVTVPIPAEHPMEGARVVVLSNRLAIVWEKSAADLVVVFDGEKMSHVQSIIMEADAETGLHWGVTLVQTPTYEQPADFLAELSRCGFAVVVEDYRPTEGLAKA